MKTACEEWRAATSRSAIQPTCPDKKPQSRMNSRGSPSVTVRGSSRPPTSRLTRYPNLGPHPNRLAWKVAEWVVRTRIDPVFNEFITSVGGQKRESPGLETMYSQRLNLLAASPHISPPPSDLPKYHRFTGAWFLDESDYNAPPTLQDFLNSGARPVIISFGSMGGTRAAETTRILVEAVELSGQRAVIQAGWGNLRLPESTESICFVEYVPHNFPFSSRAMRRASRRRGNYGGGLPRGRAFNRDSPSCRSAVLGAKTARARRCAEDVVPLRYDCRKVGAAHPPDRFFFRIDGRNGFCARRKNRRGGWLGNRG